MLSKAGPVIRTPSSIPVVNVLVDDKGLHSYTLCWDNVQIDVHCKHQDSSHANQYLMWAMQFAVKNRVNTLDMKMDDGKLATSLQPSVWVPTPEDFNNLFQREVVIIAKLLLLCMIFAKSCSHISILVSYKGIRFQVDK